MSSVISEKDVENLLQALKSAPEEIPKERESEEIGEKEKILEMGSVLGKKDIKNLLDALSYNSEEIS